MQIGIQNIKHKVPLIGHEVKGSGGTCQPQVQLRLVTSIITRHHSPSNLCLQGTSSSSSCSAVLQRNNKTTTGLAETKEQDRD